MKASSDVDKDQPTTHGESRQSEFHMPVAAPLDMSADALLHDLKHYFGRRFGQRFVKADQPFVYQSVALAVRDRLMERRAATKAAMAASNQRQVAYLSLEYLLGRLLRNALLNLDLEQAASDALEKFGMTLEDVCEREQDAGLGNGGLGRLAACFLDSCATLGLPVVSYGIRYHYGMFRQHLENGRQVEAPDSWLLEGFPWEVERPELVRRIRFGGRTEMYRDAAGVKRYRWADTNDVLAVPYDIPIPGYRNEVVNTLRLWSAAATDAFDLDEFNSGSYADAVAAKNAAENITMVLYPNAETENGQELRLRQQYFLASASLQDMLRSYAVKHGDDVSQFAEKRCVQLNDTHPAIAVPELMRLLLDEHNLGWDEAWQITRKTMAYTNHTLLPEALECWSVEMFERLLPRLLDIIYEINAQFVRDIGARWPGDNARIERMSIIAEGSPRMVRMAYLAIVGSYSVNGVAELHSRLLTEGLFRDFAELWPAKFNNKTNGVTQRRWLAACNPELTTLINEKIGTTWVTDLENLAELKNCADDEVFGQRWRAVKTANKARLATRIHELTGVQLNTDMLFDVQVKRMHEYKRQLLNVLHAIHLYDRICRGDGDHLAPRAIIIGGKAAPGYIMAKTIIKFINNAATVINHDPATKDRLKLVFYPDYNVSAMELISPAADLSAQISTAGKEASGTGNMKFMLNGALTIGTLDGANVEIRDAVGAENFFLFGLTVEDIETLRPTYDPDAIINADEDFSRVMQLVEGGHFNRFEPGVFDAIIASVRSPDDAWMTAADFRSYIDAQEAASQAYLDTADWTRKSILNTAASGRFCTDRTMREYNEGIWHVDPINLPKA
jgi:starch phosphorylase